MIIISQQLITPRRLKDDTVTLLLVSDSHLVMVGSTGMDILSNFVLVHSIAVDIHGSAPPKKST